MVVVTQINLSGETPDPALTPRNNYFNQNPPNELPRTYSPLGELPDLLQAQARRLQRVRMLAIVDEEISQNKTRVAKHQVAIERRDQLKAHVDCLRNKNLDAEASAAIADIEFDPTEIDLQISEHSLNLIEAEKDALVAGKVIQALTTKGGELSKRRIQAAQAMSNATRDWLLALHSHRVNAVRQKLHELGGDMAAILAIEEHIELHHHDPKYCLRFAEALGKALRHDSPLRPTWFGIDRASIFPGFSAAKAALESDMSAEDGQ
ncbi:hypothetical protein SAMN05880582_102195 [Rhizobium sp. RU20A]|uniref:hypothetical protein n=1 Tax=Rhizobium sp. RU20A TaxID=1907412 RepID=UPI0009540DAC|nr:hypothetical protein [Rhizobium sp. RU20A]SIQ58019.1 hypothetical protein SAMN05880582_102195 [Rhizobium sp. RU20A]